VARRRRDDRPYVQELMSFEPKIDSMIGNFRSTGYRFREHTPEDLKQELFVKALEIEDAYDIEKAAIRTWWYRCFVAHLVKLAERGDKAMKWAIAIDDVDFEIADPYFVDLSGWRREVVLRVDEMMRMLDVEDPQLARMCNTIMDLDGDKEEAAKALRIQPYVMDHGLWRLRNWQPYKDALALVPF